MEINLNLTDSQYDFYNSDKKFTLFSGGVGSGKTFIGSHYVMKKLAQSPHAKGLIGANTYRQLHNSTLNALFSEFDTYKVPFKYNKMNGILKVGNSEILCMSMDNYNMVRGVELGWFWLDEVRDTKEDAFVVLMGRLRDKMADNYEGRLTTSPSGFNWLYDYFIGHKKTDEFDLISATSHDNPFLPDGYLDTLKDSYDEKMYQQEVMGEFINISLGSVYYGFDRSRHVRDCFRNSNHPLYIGMDFNINPMTAVVTQTYNDMTYVLDEFWIMSSNTNEMAEEIKKRYGNGHTIVPDATGKALKTASSGLSDHMILKNSGFNVVGQSNPFRVDRYNCVNNLFEKGRIIIDPKCQKLIRDLEQVSYKEGTSMPDTTQKDLTHISDALGYVLYWQNPLLKAQAGVGMVPR